MNDEQREELIRLLRKGEDISPEWARVLFPPEKRESDVFDLDAVFYAEAIQKADWEVRFPLESVGKQLMAVFVDSRARVAEWPVADPISRYRY